MFGQNRQPASEACFFDKHLVVTTKSDLTGMFLRLCDLFKVRQISNNISEIEQKWLTDGISVFDV